MRNIIRIIIKKFLSRTSGKYKYQKFYNLLFDISLRGMNYKNGYFRSSGELSVMEFIANKKKHTSNNIVIFDVGANVGNYSLELSKFFNVNRTCIYSFEPSKYTFNELVKKTKDAKNIIARNFGFSDIEGKMSLFYNDVHSEFASVYNRDLTNYGIHMNKSEEIAVTTIDKFCTNNKIDKIDFMKIDVEGHEIKVLNGSIEMIKNKKIDYIQFEFGEADIDSRNFLRDFYELLNDYDFYRIVKDGLVPLGVYKEEYEIFKTINYLAIRKDQ